MMHEEELKWHQRAKQNGYKFGDRKTKVFLACASQIRTRNYITQIQDKDLILQTDLSQTQTAFTQHFSEVFPSVNPSVDDINSCL